MAIWRRDSWCRRPQQAFTLVELIVVLLIIGIAASIVVPRTHSGGQRFQVRLALHRLERDLINAQQVARARAEVVDFVFDPASEEYRCATCPSPDQRSDGLVVSLARPPYEVTLSSTTLPGDATIQIDQAGRFLDTAMVTLSSAGIAGSVRVNAGGAIEVKSP